MARKTNDDIPEFLEGKDVQTVAAMFKQHGQPISAKGLIKLCRQQNVWCRALRAKNKKIIAAMLYVVGKHEFRVLRLVGTKPQKLKLLRHLHKQLGSESGKFVVKVWVPLSDVEFLRFLRRKNMVAHSTKGDFVCMWGLVESKI